MSKKIELYKTNNLKIFPGFWNKQFRFFAYIIIQPKKHETGTPPAIAYNFAISITVLAGAFIYFLYNSAFPKDSSSNETQLVRIGPFYYFFPRLLNLFNCQFLLKNWNEWSDSDYYFVNLFFSRYLCSVKAT